jgi:hypothetical protein
MIFLFILLVLAIACGILFARALPYLIAGGLLLYVLSPGVPNPPQPVSSDQTAAPSSAQTSYLPPSSEIPAATPTPTPVVAPLPTTMYHEGLADRTAWEDWFNGLQGDFKTGAFFWAGQRSLPHPGPCNQMNADFNNGCRAAKGRLATSDALRRSDPDYKRGWNAYGSLPPADAPIPLHVASPPPVVTAPPPAITAAAPIPPKCFTVYPAVPPADCFTQAANPNGAPPRLNTAAPPSSATPKLASEEAVEREARECTEQIRGSKDLPGMIPGNYLMTPAEMYLACYRSAKCGDQDKACRARYHLSSRDHEEAITYCLEHVIPWLMEHGDPPWPSITKQQQYQICVDQVAETDNFSRWASWRASLRP